jgi:hypothetical protein
MKLWVMVACLVASTVVVAFAETAAGGEVWIQLKDGTRIVGRIIGETDEQLEVATPSGATMRFPRAAVESITSRSAGDNVPDPNDSRLFFAPTGRPLRKGTGQFTVHELMFPGVSYGLTDNVTLMGGVSIIPGLGLDQQLFYVAPKVGARVSDRFAVSAGYLFARVAEEGFENGAGIGFAVATLGGSDNSFTGGFGLAHSEGEVAPILMLGGQARLGRRLFFLSENWIILNGDVRLGEQPFSAGLRFCGDRVSVDFGLILVGELIEEGFPMPWLAFSYRFGSPRAQDTSGRRPRASRAPQSGPPRPITR